LAFLRSELSKSSGQKWSQERLAKELDLAQPVIAKAEQGKGSINNIIKIMVFYRKHGFSLDWLLDEKPNPELPPQESGQNAETLKDAFKKHIDKFNF
jgi:ribosome-binding protein aMBF1 (putative translation factor)